MTFPQVPGLDMSPKLSLQSLDVDLPDLDAQQLLVWFSAVAKTYGYTLQALTYIFCSDQALLELNVEHLQHDTFTDIITFDLRDEIDDSLIDGECYISLERVAENAASFGESYTSELHRVLVHGLLHLCGLKDKSPAEAQTMRHAEAEALQLLLQ